MSDRLYILLTGMVIGALLTTFWACVIIVVHHLLKGTCL